jgi:hypothetical protein
MVDEYFAGYPIKEFLDPLPVRFPMNNENIEIAVGGGISANDGAGQYDTRGFKTFPDPRHRLINSYLIWSFHKHNACQVTPVK